MRFFEFLRITVLISAAAASAHAAVTVAGVAGGGQSLVIELGLGWWVAAGSIGLWLGRGGQTSPAIATLLAAARTQRSLPEVNPARTVLNRLWPLVLSTVGAAALGLVAPQVPAIATGFAVIWSLAWRRQASAVKAIEDRDGARFYIDRTPPLSAIKLVRTPGFRTNLQDLNGAQARPTAQL